jgi:glycerate kinase
VTVAGRRTILIAPDSFKGSLTSVQVAQALADGWLRARPDDEVVMCPLADGGEGTLAAIEAAGGWTSRSSRVHDPLRRLIDARWLLSSDGSRAVVEMAEASGLSRVAPAERDPIGATSVGTGELVGAAIDVGARHVTLGIGGSATTDGGRGLLEGLADGGRRLDATDVEVACDVSNPLLGPTGAAATYGPQKGASPEDVAALDARNAAWADELEATEGRRERDTPGAGAAGGVGFGLLAAQGRFRSFALRPGIDLVMEATDFPARLSRADLVITGEGRIDAQTAFGKTALGVAKRAAAAGVPCIAVGGGVEVDGIRALAEVGATAVPIVERPMSVEEAMTAGVDPLVRCGERLARLIDLVR